MGKPGVTRAQGNRELRRQNLREYLSARQLTRQVVEISDRLACLEDELDARQVSRLKAAADIKLQLIKKFLPDARPEPEEIPEAEPTRVGVSETQALLDRLIREAQGSDLPQICHSDPPHHPTPTNDYQRSREPTG